MPIHAGDVTRALPREAGWLSRRLAPVCAADAALLSATVLGLAVRLYLLARPGFLSSVLQYDDGVDFGAAIGLTHGFLPYRDYAFVQPPGIIWLLAPVALLAKATTMHFGFALARIVTALVGAASVPLAGLLVRRRGVLCTTFTCGILAVYPDAIGASSSVFLEPWLVLFCLLALLALFEGDQLTAARRRLLLGGLAFGFAGAIKVWALVPVLVVLAMLVVRGGWSRLRPFSGGLLVGFGAPVLPFAALAPWAFWHSVAVAQLSRGDSFRLPVLNRLGSLLGFGGFASPGSLVGMNGAVTDRLEIVLLSAGVGGLILGSSVYASILARRRPPPLESLALATTGLMAAMFMWPTDYYFHYGGFLAPFLALAIGLPVSRLASVMSERGRSAGLPRPFGQPTRWLTAIASLAFVAMGLHLIGQARALSAPTPPSALARSIPSGTCVLSDDPTEMITVNRFLSSRPGCSPVVDPIGIDYALSGGRNASSGAASNAAVRAAWLTAFRHAQYVWLDCGPPAAVACALDTNRRIPWTPGIREYLRSHFRLMPGAGGFLYARDDQLAQSAGTM